MRTLAAVLLASALALPAYGQATAQHAEEERFEDAKLQLSSMVRRFKVAEEFVSVEDICAMACERSHGTEYNALWKNCLAEAYSLMRNEQNLLMTYAMRFSITDVAAYGTLLNERIELIEKHLEQHPQIPEQNKSAKK